MSTHEASIATSIIGLIGVPLQLFLYPRVQKYFGTIRSYKIFSGLFPLSYSLMPFLSLGQSDNDKIKLHTGISLAFILTLHTIGRVISVPATISLLNDSSPDPSRLGVVNGIGQSVSAVSRTLGPIIAAYSFAYGLENEFIGILWWILALVALAGTVLIN
jgi:hypothetical protein